MPLWAINVEGLQVCQKTEWRPHLGAGHDTTQHSALVPTALLHMLRKDSTERPHSQISWFWCSSMVADSVVKASQGKLMTRSRNSIRVYDMSTCICYSSGWLNDNRKNSQTLACSHAFNAMQETSHCLPRPPAIDSKKKRQKKKTEIIDHTPGIFDRPGPRWVA